MTQPELFLRITVIGGDRLDNDYDVFFEGRRVGRIREATERDQSAAAGPAMG